MKTPVLLAAMALLMTGCVTQTPGAPAATTASAAVAAVSAAEAGLAAAGKVVLACYQVPACAARAPKPAIKGAYDQAYSLVTQAQAIADAGGSPDTITLDAAISALQGLVAQLPVTSPA